MTPLPPDLQEVLDQIDAADRDGASLAAPLSEEQFGWQPDGGGSWSVGQCLEHLAVINVLYGDAVRSGIERAHARGWHRQGPLAPGIFGRWFVRSLEPPVKLRSRAPGTVHPRAQLPKAEVLRQYHDAHDRVRALVRNAAGIDANRATFQNPFVRFVRVRVATGLQVIPAHDRRHLWQARRVIERPDFPR